MTQTDLAARYAIIRGVSQRQAFEEIKTMVDIMKEELSKEGGKIFFKGFLEIYQRVTKGRKMPVRRVLWTKAKDGSKACVKRDVPLVMPESWSDPRYKLVIRTHKSYIQNTLKHIPITRKLDNKGNIIEDE